MNQPLLTTERLILRPFELSDAGSVQRLAGDREIALNTLTIPHPYPDGAANAFIAMVTDAFGAGSAAVFAITLRETGELAGAVGLHFKESESAELGYWIGRPYWQRGIASEAVQAILEYGFAERRLHRIFAIHFSRNPASGRVMIKNGMRHEGTHREAVLKWGEFLDVEAYAILAKEWLSRSG